MKKTISVTLVIAMVLINSIAGYAKEGDCGYEGGISSCKSLISSKTSSQFDYKEVVFLSGTPIVMTGKVTLKKKVNATTETNTYTYSLANGDNTLKRTVVLQTNIIKKDNNQITKETSIYGTPSETVVIGSKTYVLSSYNLTKTSIVDVKPAIEYYAGSLETKKVYTAGTGNTITESLTGQFYGYNQNWSNSEVQILDYTLEGDSANDNWSGTARVKLASNFTTDFKYVKNYPEEISFEGGFVQSQSTTNKLIYQTDMPEFDKNGVSTDRVITKTGNLKIDTFPNEKRLPTFDLAQIRGHWAENDIEKLYGLEILSEAVPLYMPNQYITRGEFAQILYKYLNVNVTTQTTKKSKTVKEIPQYEDVPITDPNFKYIKDVTNKNIMTGYGDGKFHPNDLLTRAQVAQTFIAMLGLERMSKDEYPVTTFKDNDAIPRWAQRSVYVANRIGVMNGDNGYFAPNNYLTKAEAAASISRLTDYITKDLVKSYSDKILNFD